MCVFQLFKGKFYYCVGLDVKNITNKSDCLLAKYKWVHHKYNFDNLGQVHVYKCHIYSYIIPPRKSYICDICNHTFVTTLFELID